MNTNNTVKPNGQPLINKIVDLYRLLEPFGIRPQNHRTGPHKDKVAKGYNQKDFEQSWESHLPETRGTAALGCESSDVAADLQDLSDLSKDISGQQLAARS